MSTTFLTSLLSVSLVDLIYGAFLKESEVNEIVSGVAKARLPLRLYPNQDDAYTREIDDFIKQNDVKEVKLFEYSALTVFSMLDTLRIKGCKIKLLVKNPDSEENSIEKSRINSSLSTLFEVFGDSLGKTGEIKCYSTSGSIRGRLFDDSKIVLGWYSYQYNTEKETCFPSVRGHDNPILVADKGSTEFDELKQMFERSFDSVWKNKTSVDCKTFLKK